MRASLNIWTTRHRRAAFAPRSRGFRLRRPVGALLALTGFVSQYPIPVIHQCEVMNPNGIDLLAGHDHHAHQKDHEPDRRLAGAHAEIGLSDDDAHVHLPSCHRRLLAVADSAAANHGEHAEAREGEGGGHSHNSCPVCQGHAQLLPDLPQALAALDTHFYLISLRRPALVQTIVRREPERLPDSRAPPA